MYTPSPKTTIPTNNSTARKDRWEDCHAVLTLVHGKGNPNSPLVSQELSDIREMCEFEARNKDVTYWELLTPKYLNRTHIGVSMQIWSQLTGEFWELLSLAVILADLLIRNERHDVLHHLRLRHGRLHRQRKPPRLLDP